MNETNLNELKQAVTVAQAHLDVLATEYAHNPSDYNADALQQADEAYEVACRAYDTALQAEADRLYAARNTALHHYFYAVERAAIEQTEVSREAARIACDAYTAASEACRAHRKNPSR